MTQFAQGFWLRFDGYVRGLRQTVCRPFERGRYSCRYRNAYAGLWLRAGQAFEDFFVTSQAGVHRGVCGATLLASPMKSPKCESSSSPIGVSIEIGFGDFRDFADFVFRHFHQLGKFGGIGLSPVSCRYWREMRFILLMVSIMCTGIRMVRLVGNRAGNRWRIHHVA